MDDDLKDLDAAGMHLEDEMLDDDGLPIKKPVVDGEEEEEDDSEDDA